MRELEHVQKRATSIICPSHSYHEALDIMNFKQLAVHHDEIFDTIANGNNHLLYNGETTYLLRRVQPFNVPRFTTDRFRNSAIISLCLKANSA